jgi:hypothetical protein
LVLFGVCLLRTTLSRISSGEFLVLTLACSPGYNSVSSCFGVAPLVWSILSSFGFPVVALELPTSLRSLLYPLLGEFPIVTLAHSPGYNPVSSCFGSLVFFLFPLLELPLAFCCECPPSPDWMFFLFILLCTSPWKA